jgi:hypothetical protein
MHNGKKQIYEILDKIHEIETFNLQDGSELLPDQISEPEKERILHMAMMQINQDGEENKQLAAGLKHKRGNKKRKVLAAAVAAVFIFASTTVAAEVFHWDHRISGLLGINPENSAQLEGSGMNLDVGTEQNGVTIKAVQSLGDANNIYVLFEVTSPKGAALDTGSRFKMVYLRVGDITDGPTGMGYACTFCG